MDQDKKYEPEIGQALFGQPFEEYAIQPDVESVLNALREIFNVFKGVNNNPFGNTGASWKNNVFEVKAYSWSDEADQEYNFKWKDFTVSWYKYLGRGGSQNKILTTDEIEQMAKECLSSLINS